MKKMTMHNAEPRLWTVALIVILMTGCSAHNPFIIKNTTNVHSLSVNKFTAQQGKIFLTKEALSKDLGYEEIAQIEVGKIWYGGAEWVYATFAERAKKMGADAVVEIRTWHQPAGFAWATPHGSGKAIKFNNPSSVDLSKIKGEWQ